MSKKIRKQLDIKPSGRLLPISHKETLGFTGSTASNGSLESLFAQYLLKDKFFRKVLTNSYKVAKENNEFCSDCRGRMEDIMSKINLIFSLKDHSS